MVYMYSTCNEILETTKKLEIINLADISCTFNTLRQGNWRSSGNRYKKYVTWCKTPFGGKILSVRAFLAHVVQTNHISLLQHKLNLAQTRAQY